MRIGQLSLLAFVIVVGGSLLSVGCSRGANLTEQEHIQRAKAYADKDDLKAAIIELKNAASENPKSPEPRLLLGHIYLRAGLGQAAEQALQKARELGVREEAIKIPLGEALLLQRQFKRVLDEVQPDAKATRALLAKILRVRGDAEFGLGQLKAGCALYQKANQGDVPDVPTYRGLARCAAAEGKLDEAKTQLDEALKLDSHDAESWVLLGNLEAIRKNPQVAENAYRSASKSDSRNAGAYVGLAMLYLRQGEPTKAAKEVNAARKAIPNNLLIRYLHALLFFEQKRYTDARDEIQQILSVAPDHMPSLLLAGAVAYALGSYEQARDDTARFVAWSPRHPFAVKLLAAINLKLNRPGDAIAILEPFLANGSKDVRLLSLVGEAYFQNKDYAKATEYLAQAAALEPKNAALRTQLGVSRLSAGEPQRAEADLEAAAALDPGQIADSLLILTPLGQGAYDAALAAARAWEKKQPDNPAAYNMEGGAQLAKKDFG